MPNAVWSKPKTVLVTGGTGFVGTYVCRLLARQGQSAIAVGIEPFSEEAQFVLGDAAATTRFVRGDVVDAAGLDAICAQYAPDAIVHAAGLVGHDTSLADPAKTYAVNVGGTVNVFEAARRANIAQSFVDQQQRRLSPQRTRRVRRNASDDVALFRQSECPLRRV